MRSTRGGFNDQANTGKRGDVLPREVDRSKPSPGLCQTDSMVDECSVAVLNVHGNYTFLHGQKMRNEPHVNTDQIPKTEIS